MICTRKSHKAWGRWPLAGKRLIKRIEIFPSLEPHFKNQSHNFIKTYFIQYGKHTKYLIKSHWLVVKCDTPSEHAV